MLGEVTEDGAGLAEVGHSPADLFEVLVDEVGDVAAGGLATVTKGEDAADLGEREAGVPSITDERGAALGGGRVIAVAT